MWFSQNMLDMKQGLFLVDWCDEMLISVDVMEKMGMEKSCGKAGSCRFDRKERAGSANPTKHP